MIADEFLLIYRLIVAALVADQVRAHWPVYLQIGGMQINVSVLCVT